MKKLVLATNNAHKVEEMKKLLEGSGYVIQTLSEVGFSGEIEENGTTFEENSYIKAATVSKKLGCIAVADDSGLEVDCLGGAPGVYSARYAGEHATDTQNLDKLLCAVAGQKDRRARFVSVITAVFEDGSTLSARGECEGIIIDERRGAGDFGYDPVFFYEPAGKTFAEMTMQEKNAVSHRGRAMKKFAEMFFLDKRSR